MKNNRVWFYIRVIVFILLGIAPAVYLIIKFRCFEFTNRLSIGGWGVLSVIIFFAVIYIFLKYLVYGGPWAYRKQCVKTIMTIVLPMALAITLAILAKNYFDELIIFLTVAAGCWISAGFINPFPKRIHDKTLGETADVVEYAMKKVKKEEDK